MLSAAHRPSDIEQGQGFLHVRRVGVSSEDDAELLVAGGSGDRGGED